MFRFKALMIAAPVAVGLLAAPAAHAEWPGHRGGGWQGGGGGWHGGGGDWRGDGGWRGGYGRHHDRGPGIAGAILGLGAAAVIGGVIASQAYSPPPVVYAQPPYGYAPPPVVYAPPPPVYYAPPPAYYQPQPGYYVAAPGYYR